MWHNTARPVRHLDTVVKQIKHGKYISWKNILDRLEREKKGKILNLYLLQNIQLVFLLHCGCCVIPVTASSLCCGTCCHHHVPGCNPPHNCDMIKSAGPSCSGTVVISHTVMHMSTMSLWCHWWHKAINNLVSLSLLWHCPQVSYHIPLITLWSWWCPHHAILVTLEWLYP